MSLPADQMGFRTSEEAPATPTDAAAGSNPPENNEDEARAFTCSMMVRLCLAILPGLFFGLQALVVFLLSRSE